MTGNRKIYVMDLDECLIDNTKGKLYPDVKNILTKLRSGGHLIFLASFNKRAPEVLKKQKIDHLFHGGAYGFNNSKHRMIEQIVQHLRNNKGLFDIGKIEFYDDKLDNISEVTIKSRGKIKAIHVPNGLSWEHIE